MDSNLIRKIYPSIGWAWAIAMTWCLMLKKPWVALSITFGTILGTAVFMSYDMVVRKVIVPGAQSFRKPLLVLALIKYPLMGLYVYLLVKWGRIDMLAFCGGVTLVYIAMLAKVAGIRMMERRKEKSAGDDEER